MDEDENFAEYIEKFCEGLRGIFSNRMSYLQPNIYQNTAYEVICTLLARIITVNINFAGAPYAWTSHLAPSIVRPMIDATITLKYIMDDPDNRALSFKQYGLGQEKLFIEHLRYLQKENPGNEGISEQIDNRMRWLEWQQAEWSTDVNVGSWSGVSLRDMAKKSGTKEIYDLQYTEFSFAVHNTWPHLGRHHTQICENPLHKYHNVPVIGKINPDPFFLFLAAHITSNALQYIDQNFGIQNEPYPEDFLEDDGYASEP